MSLEAVLMKMNDECNLVDPLTAGVFDGLIKELRAFPLTLEECQPPPQKRRKIEEYGSRTKQSLPEMDDGEETTHEASQTILDGSVEDQYQPYSYPDSLFVRQSHQCLDMPMYSSQSGQVPVVSGDNSSHVEVPHFPNSMCPIFSEVGIDSNTVKCNVSKHDYSTVNAKTSPEAESPTDGMHYTGHRCMNAGVGMTCSDCCSNLLNAPASQRITCVHCGDAIDVKEQHTHPCITQGLMSPYCLDCKTLQECSFDSQQSTPNTTRTESAINSYPSDSSHSMPRKRGRKAKCDKCKLVFKSIQCKQEHMMREHQEELSCGICQATLRSEENLRRHMLCHSDDASHFCPKCDASFNHRRSLRVHLRHCGVENNVIPQETERPIERDEDTKRYSCAFCPKRFSVRPSVSRHVRIVHQGLRPHTCSFCNKTFTSKYNMQVHCMKNHSNRN